MSRAEEVLFLVDRQAARLVVCRRGRVRAGFRNGRSCAECASRSVSASSCFEFYPDLAQRDCRFRARSCQSPFYKADRRQLSATAQARITKRNGRDRKFGSETKVEGQRAIVLK